MTEKERGEILYSGIRGDWKDSLRQQKINFGLCIFGFCGVGLILSLLFTGVLKIAISGVPIVVSYGFLIFGLLFCIVVLTMGLVICGGGEVHAIYENGVTSADTTLIDRLKGRRFHKFEAITKIGIGGAPKSYLGKESDFVILYERNSKQPTVPAYYRPQYKNDFYDKLIEILKKRCPNAKWVEVDWKSLPFWKR